ncbi:hypothetical protein JTE90_024097 [Oedothorax gibbosus]|uniref:Uncharacterized protein n=1 Tax=Oedothorax gibbosus TaxID=931172 RepID=A0AAV6UTG7_9ARAC|nr:hypothetical protein JTE90_024097 [Oedothorax gibbosus]
MIYSTSGSAANVNDSFSINHNFPSKNHTNVTILGTNDRNNTNVGVNITNADVSVNATIASFIANITYASFDVNVTDVNDNVTMNIPTPGDIANIFKKIHRTVTRSKDAIWATVTLTFVCVLLLLAVAQSKMWKDHHYRESQGIPLPDFNERVLFKDVMEHKLNSLKRMFKKKKKKENVTEMKSLLVSDEEQDEDSV